MDLLSVLNLVFTIALCAVAIWGYTKRKYDVLLYIAIGYGIFTVAHLLVLIGLAASLNSLLIVLRVVAYLIIIIAVYKLATKK
jgi:predicted membrane channel-forming protein YqfA (hemolysin III family)